MTFQDCKQFLCMQHLHSPHSTAESSCTNNGMILATFETAAELDEVFSIMGKIFFVIVCCTKMQVLMLQQHKNTKKILLLFYRQKTVTTNISFLQKMIGATTTSGLACTTMPPSPAPVLGVPASSPGGTHHLQGRHTSMLRWSTPLTPSPPPPLFPT